MFDIICYIIYNPPWSLST